MKLSCSACLLLVIIALGQPAHAQISNASFESGDFSGWTTAGDPTVTGPQQNAPIPNGGTTQALITTTDSGAAGGNAAVFGEQNSVSAAALDTFLGTTLPSNPINPSNPVANNDPVNGEAIKQTFTLAEGERLTFSFKFASREINGLLADNTGYTINGQFHSIQSGLPQGVLQFNQGVGFLDAGIPVRSVTIILPAGVDTLGFVAYNTFNAASATGFFLTDLQLSPLFSTVPGLDPNQRSIASYIDAHSGNPSPALQKVITSLEGLPASEIPGALNGLSPESLGIFRNIAFDNSSFFSEDVNNHLANLRDGLTGFDTSRFNVSNPSASPMANKIARHLDPKEMRDPKEMSRLSDTKLDLTPSNYDANRWSVWLSGDVLLADLSHNEDVEHENYTTTSVMLGADYRLGAHFTVGALVGYGHSGVTLDNEGSKGTADTYYPAIYASYVDGGWYANALAAYNYNSYTDARHVALPGLSGFDNGATDGHEYLADLRGGYEFRNGPWKYGPFADLQYVHFEMNSFTEDGPTALSYQNQSDDSLRSQLGFEVRYATQIGDVGLVPHLSAAWQHEFLANSRGITSSFQGNGGGTFSVLTQRADEDSAFIDVGIDANLDRNWTLFLDYQTEAGGDNFYAQSFSGGVRYGF